MDDPVDDQAADQVDDPAGDQAADQVDDPAGDHVQPVKELNLFQQMSKMPNAFQNQVRMHRQVSFTRVKVTHKTSSMCAKQKT